MARVCFGDLAYLQEDPRIAQPAIATVSLAEYRAWQEITEKEPDVVTGLSMGLYTAAGASGAINSDAETIDLIGRRARIMHDIAEHNPGTMMAILGLLKEELEPALNKVSAELGVLKIGVLRDRKHIVVTGTHRAIKSAREFASAHGAKRMVGLPIGMAAHSDLQRDTVVPLKIELDKVIINDPKVLLVSNDAKYLTSRSDVTIHLLEQMTSYADLESTLEFLAKEGIKRAIQFGPDRKRGMTKQMEKNFGTVPIQFPIAA